MNWTISQRWEHVLFMHHAVDPELIQSCLPEGLKCDTWKGEAYIGIIPFKMSQICFKSLPPVPFTSLWELNLRTYVRNGNRSGIYFFTLDSTHILGNWIARNFFELPYRSARISSRIENEIYQFESRNSLSLVAKIQDERIEKRYSEAEVSRQRWLSERYFLFTQSASKGLLMGEVNHKAWELRAAEIQSCTNHFSGPLGFKLKGNFIPLSYCSQIDVKFKAFVSVDR